MPGAKRLIPTRRDINSAFLGGPGYSSPGSPKAARSDAGARKSSSRVGGNSASCALRASGQQVGRTTGKTVAAFASGTETSPDIDVEEKLKDAFTRGWSVIVWNDPINLMDYVVYVFKSVLKMNEQDASRHMWEVHQKGKSIVARETREKSELLVHRLRGFGLNATLEKA